MARTKSIEEVINAEVTHFNENFKVPARLQDDCNQEIAIAVITAYQDSDTTSSWFTWNIRNAAEAAGKRYIKSEKKYESHMSHDKDDEEFLEEMAICRIRHRATCNVLNTRIVEILRTTGFNEREVKIVLMILNSPEGGITFEELGAEFGVHRNRIRQIYARILRKFRHPSRSRILMDYFDIL